MSTKKTDNNMAVLSEREYECFPLMVSTINQFQQVQTKPGRKRKREEPQNTTEGLSEYYLIKVSIHKEGIDAHLIELSKIPIKLIDETLFSSRMSLFVGALEHGLYLSHPSNLFCTDAIHNYKVKLNCFIVRQNSTETDQEPFFISEFNLSLVLELDMAVMERYLLKFFKEFPYKWPTKYSAKYC